MGHTELGFSAMGRDEFGVQTVTVLRIQRTVHCCTTYYRAMRD